MGGMTTPKWIQLRAAAENNLRNIDVDIPLHRLTVVCGVSGSGKTSLVLDTLFAEGQRRYIESFSAYTRQFLARIEKPKFDSLDNLPPSLSITRGDRSRNNRSTVGTASELMEPLRVLFARIARLYCTRCGREVHEHTPSSVMRFLGTLKAGRGMLGFAFEWSDKTDLSQQLFDFQSTGLIRVLLDGHIVELSQDRTELAKSVSKSGSGIVILERFQLGHADRLSSLVPALEDAFSQAASEVLLLVESDALDVNGATTYSIDGRTYVEHRFSRELRCSECGLDYLPAEPRLFNFNSPIGACPSCTGFGEIASITRDKIVPDRSLSLRDGAIAPWRSPSYAHELEELLAIASAYKVAVDVPVSQLTDKQWEVIQRGVPARKFGGLDGFFAWLERRKYKMHIRAFLSRWRSYEICPECRGARLSQSALAYRYGTEHFWDLCEKPIAELREAISQLRLIERLPNGVETSSISSAISEVENRLQYLDSVGLGYLTLARTMHTLSGGEAQRVQLTTLLGSDLVDMLYVLDEPTVGLHPSDTQRVAESIERLVDRGNTVVLIEHEPYLLFRAKHVLEIGPGAGEKGGQVCFAGTPSAWKKANTLTSRFLFAEKSTQRSIRNIGPTRLRLIGAKGRNLHGDALEIPHGCLTTIVGVSGSGKSTLILDTLVPALRRELGEETDDGLPFERLEGLGEIAGCVAIDQSPIAKSIRSTPATYVKAMDEIRAIFGGLPAARGARLTASHFSFNSSAGRCPVCEGLGFTVVDMQFMADVRLTCSQCNGARYQPEVLAVRYRDRNIAEVLQMGIAASVDFFRGEHKLHRKLQPLLDIGLGYLPLGQCVSSLSAGESMRLKLASHLEEKSSSLIVMDEPTTGLHFADVELLIHCIDVLIDRGNTVLVIEHNEQMIRASDYLIEMGPGAGPGGGRIIDASPRDVFLASANTPTKRALQTNIQAY